MTRGQQSLRHGAGGEDVSLGGRFLLRGGGAADGFDFGRRMLHVRVMTASLPAAAAAAAVRRDGRGARSACLFLFRDRRRRRRCIRRLAQ